MKLHMNPFKGRHFQRDIILWAVRWYCKYGISYRELQEMLAERGVNVDHPRFTAVYSVMRLKWEKRLRWYWRNPSDLCPWHMDETYGRSTAAGRICRSGRRQPGPHCRFYLSSVVTAKLHTGFQNLNNEEVADPGRFING